jgi:hypothetical protein
MIAPHDLLALAEALAKRPDEATRLAAVSRAYYGAFHRIRQTLEQTCGLILAAGPEVHRKMQFCLENSQHPELVGIGDELRSLREERNIADYRLDNSKFAQPMTVLLQVERAKDIASRIDAVDSNAVGFVDNIRSYASDVLKIPLKPLRN